jgi:site-specific recombinase XerD
VPKFARLFIPDGFSIFGNKHEIYMRRATFKKVFNLKKKLNREGEAPIYIRIIIDRKAFYLNSGEYIRPKFWNAKKLEVTLDHPRHQAINTAVDTMINRMKNHTLQCSLTNELVSFEGLKQLFEVKVPVITSFTKFFEAEIQTRNDIEISTQTNHRRTFTILCEFKPQILFKDLTFELIQNFEYFLIGKGHSANTRGKYHKNIKTYINSAIDKGLFLRDNNPYNKFRAPRAGTNRDSLTLKEIEKLETLGFEPHSAHLEKVRDMFVFSCYAGGLRISDIITLEKKHLHIEDEKVLLSKRMVKGMKKGKHVNLPLHDLFSGKPKRIIEKYLVNNSSDRVFPQLSEQQINRSLKELAHLIGFNKKLTFHIARHSFGTNAIEILGDPTLVKELMGHSKIDTTMIYVHKSPERISKQLRNIDWDRNK